MGISSALNAGVSGLSANSTRLATISDNIANSETFGYKRAEADFASLVLDGNSGPFAAGGVRVSTFRNVAAQGSLITTGNATDISISGRGFIPVTSFAGLTAEDASRPLQLTTTGSFSQDEAGFLRSAGGLFLMGWPADAAGSVTVPGRDSAAGLEPVNLTASLLSTSPTTQIDLGANLPATATEAGSSGAPLEIPVQYFDNLGRSNTVTLRFSPTVPAAGSSNSWTAEIFDSAGDPAVAVGSFEVTFADTPPSAGSLETVTPAAGTAYDPETGILTAPLSGQDVEFALLDPTGRSLLTQFSSSFSPLGVSANGLPVGNLASVEIGEDGFLDAIYDSGFRRTIYQIPVGDVPNPNGLRTSSNSAFEVSQSSGDIFFYDAGTGPVGTTVGFSLAESTTDIAEELTDLIQTQRAYSSNARIVQTIDEILEETTNIIR